MAWVFRGVGVETMKLVLMDDSHNSAYDDFLAQVDVALLYHTRSYKMLLERLLGCESQYWLAINQGKIEGVLPLMASHGPYGTVINSLPYYGSIGAVLARNRNAQELLINKYNEIINEKGVASATMVSNPFDHASSHGVDHDLTDIRIGQVTGLPNGSREEVANEIFKIITGSARRNINKARRCGISVFVDNMAMDFLYRVHVDNIMSIGGKPKSRLFFDLIPKIFEAGKEYRIYIARIGTRGEPVAALLVFYFKETVEYFIPATIREYRGQQPMAAILWRAIRDAGTMGYRQWNWGGTWVSQEGVYRFKKKWGARDLEYRYFIKLNNKKILEENPGRLGGYYKDFYVVPFSALEGNDCNA